MKSSAESQDTSLVSTSQVTGIAKAMAGLSEIGLSGIETEDLPNLLPPDRMALPLESWQTFGPTSKVDR